MELDRKQMLSIMPELAGKNIDVTELKGGITNKLYRVGIKRGEEYVFRFYGVKTDMFINREVEVETMRLIEPLCISPRVIKYLPRKNVTVIEFIDGYTLKNTDFLKKYLWDKIIKPIKVLHTSKITVSKTFHPLVEIKSLYKIMRKINVKYPEFPIEETIKRLEKINDIVSFSPDEYVLCHNDLLADNFMLVNNNESMYIIDWEYAGMGICYYDLADMFQEILVPKEIERNLLDIYWGGKDLEYNMYMIDLFKPFPDVYWFLWSIIQQNISTIDFDYYNYGKTKFENAQKNIYDIREVHGLRL